MAGFIPAIHRPRNDVQRREFDAFAARNGVRVLPVPTGQGLIFKP